MSEPVVDIVSRPPIGAVLVLGATGMLGHKIVQVLRSCMETWAGVRRMPPPSLFDALFDSERTIAGVESSRMETVLAALDAAKPEVVVNCVGVVRQSALIHDPITAIGVNALFPHQLARACAERGARLIHISTDCVFSGKKGMYREDDVPDAEDVYGRTKLLGDVTAPRTLTIRTSLIGRELHGSRGLIEWFLSNRNNSVPGYTRAIFSGLTTLAMGEIIRRIITEAPSLDGIYHVASEPISKHDLLARIGTALGLRGELRPDASLAIDRSLDASRFLADSGIRVPGWDAMINRLACDPTPYDVWRLMFDAP